MSDFSLNNSTVFSTFNNRFNLSATNSIGDIRNEPISTNINEKCSLALAERKLLIFLMSYNYISYQHKLLASLFLNLSVVDYEFSKRNNPSYQLYPTDFVVVRIFMYEYYHNFKLYLRFYRSIHKISLNDIISLIKQNKIIRYVFLCKL